MSYDAGPYAIFLRSTVYNISSLYVCMYVYSLASISGESHIEHIN